MYAWRRPCRGWLGPVWCPSSSLGVSPRPVHRVPGDTEMGWLCIFAPQHFLDLLRQTGSEPRVPTFPWGGSPFCPSGEGKNHTGWGGGGWSPPPGSMCGLLVGGVCPEVSAREAVLRTAELTWTCSSWAPALGPRRAARLRPRAPWGPSTWRRLPPAVGVGGAHRPTPALPTLGYTGILRAVLGLRPGSVGLSLIHI